MYTRTCTSEHPIPKIVCLCGSTRFANEFMAASFQETLDGNIVLSVGCFPRKPDGSWDAAIVSDAQKVELDELHKRKIDLADEIFVLNVNGYVGASTASEIAYCRQLKKPIRWRDISTDGGKTWEVTRGVEVWAESQHVERYNVEYTEVPVPMTAHSMNAIVVQPEQLDPTRTLRAEDYVEKQTGQYL